MDVKDHISEILKEGRLEEALLTAEACTKLTEDEEAYNEIGLILFNFNSFQKESIKYTQEQIKVENLKMVSSLQAFLARTDFPQGKNYAQAFDLFTKTRDNVNKSVDKPAKGILEQINCDRKDFIRRFENTIWDKTDAPCLLFLVPGTEAQQANSLIERMVLEYARLVENKGRKIFYQQNDHEKRLRLFDFNAHKRGFLGSLSMNLGMAKSHASPQELLRECRQKRPRYGAFAFAFELEESAWNEDCGDLLLWLAQGDYSACPNSLFFVHILLEEGEKPKGSFFSKLFGGAKKEDPHQELRTALKKLEKQQNNIIVFDKLPPVPIKYIDDWLKDFEGNSSKRKKLLEEALSEMDVEVQKRYKKDEQLDMSDIELMTEHLLAGFRPAI